MNINESEITWVLVWNGSNVVEIVEPGHHTETISNLKEFDTEDELNQFIVDNNLTVKEQ